MKACFAIVSLYLYQTFAWNHVENKELIESTLKNNDRTLVAYIFPDEEHSQLLEPEWLSAATSRKDFVSIDCSKHSKLCQSHGISSFPTIRLHQPHKSPVRYRGPRTAHSILRFLERAKRPSVVSQVTSKNMTAFQSIDDVVFIGHLSSDIDKETFTALAKKYSDRFSFALASPSSFGAAAPKIECFNTLDSVSHTTTDLSNQNLNRFIKLCSTPLIPELTRSNELLYYSTGKSILHYFPPLPPSSSSAQVGDQESYIKAVRPLAKKYQEYIHFVITSPREFPEAMEMMGLTGGNHKKDGRGKLSLQKGHEVFPLLGDDSSSSNFKWNAEVVEGFLGGIIRGKVRPWNGVSGGNGNGKGNGREGGRDEL